jgi:hypothetical protein
MDRFFASQRIASDKIKCQSTNTQTDMIRIEKEKLIIEFETLDPEQFYKHLLKGIPTCIQAITEQGMDGCDRELPHSLYTLIDLYKQILPTEKQIDRMLKKGK